MSQELSPIEKKRHSLSHLMSMAILERYPNAGLGVGPWIENGWYQDYDLPEPISEKDFEWIEKRMREFIKEDIEFKQEIHSIEETRELVKGDFYKAAIAEELIEKGEKELSFYRTGNNFLNLCGGPHVERTSEIHPDSFKLVSVAGAYWRGDEKNKMLTRIYGVAFETKEELEKYLHMQEEAKKRDHRKLGKELDLFVFSDLVGAGLPLFTPRGSFIRRELNNYIESLQAAEGYMQVWTPQIVKAKLFQVSGHYDKYKDDMFHVASNYSDEEFYLKPMNCPQHTQIYASRARSYRDLPIRLTDFAMLYRDEKPGELNGLARVRSFSQDDCHIFCREDQVDEEIDRALAMTKQVMENFGFKYRYRLSTRDPEHPEKYFGNPETWDKAEKWAVEIMERNGIEYFDGQGEASFYAPKMDLIVTDALGRDWQLSTIQIDYVMPERFGLEYTDKDGSKKSPIMVHRAIMGSPERFMMILTEHFAGAFPVWLSPVQVAILPVGENFLSFAHELGKQLKEQSVRVEVDESNESVGKKIRNAESMKVPYMLVVGEKEKSSGKLAVRKRGQKDTKEMSVEEFIESVKEEIQERRSS